MVWLEVAGIFGFWRLPFWGPARVARLTCPGDPTRTTLEHNEATVRLVSSACRLSGPPRRSSRVPGHPARRGEVVRVLVGLPGPGLRRARGRPDRRDRAARGRQVHP